MISEQVEVLIIGAGVVGAALARELSRYQLRVLLVEKEVDVSFGTSKANSGIVHSGIHDHPGTIKARLCVRGNRLYPELAAELNVLYKQNGTLVVARDQSELPALENLRKQGLANGVGEITFLKRDELLRLEPNLAPTLAGGLLVPSGGIVVPFDLVFALVENARANGVQLAVATKVEKIEIGTDQFLVYTNRGITKAKYIVNAAGLSSAAVARMIGDESFNIYARKGEEYLLDRKLEGLVRRTIFPLPSPESKGILVIPTVDGNIMLGPTAHRVGSFSDLSTSASGWEEIFNYTSKLVPGIRPADLITSFSGLRAAEERGKFIIRSSHISPRFIHAAGIESPGLTAAPAIALEIKEILKEAGLELRPKPNFNPIRPLIRFRQLSEAEQAQLIEKDPTYARVVCRCETITEGEIREAIRRGANTLDGVKLRTRSGMGRCQGGFCTPKILDLLVEELGINPESVSKNGPGSELLTGRLRMVKEGKHNVRNIS
ncbi:MAG TPA: NAD(P)/FAD-dependent oxidoreductase [Bacillota bacterium]